jgi:hypothetical protein
MAGNKSVDAADAEVKKRDRKGILKTNEDGRLTPHPSKHLSLMQVQ